jgi:hypothetical protein
MEPTIENSLEALTDIALYVSIYGAVVATMFAMGPPQTRGEEMGRVVAAWLMAVASVVLIVWLCIGIVARIYLVSNYP